MSEEIQHGRRAMLARGGAVLAGLAGAGAVGAVLAPAASAAPGDPVNQGELNNAGASKTDLTSTAAQGTLELTNTSPANAAPLRLAPVANPSVLPNSESRSGDLFNYSGDLAVTHAGAESGLTEPIVGFAYTTANANMLVPITPERVLDTRSSAGRSNIVNPGSALDSQGRLKAGRTIKIRLDGLVVFGTAVNCNVTVVSPLSAGFATLLPEDPGGAPGTATVNYVAGQVVGNFAVSGIGFLDGDISDYVYLYTHATTHLVLDATGFAVGHPAQVNIAGAAVQGQQDDATTERQRKAAAYIAAQRAGK
ncbi:MAG: hypothetical protein ACRDQ7_02110 [Haloechinothrix sp.]